MARMSGCQSEGTGSIPVSPAAMYVLACWTQASSSFTIAWRGIVACRQANRQALFRMIDPMAGYLVVSKAAWVRFPHHPLNATGVGPMAKTACCQPADAGSIPVPPSKASPAACPCSLTYWLYHLIVDRSRGGIITLPDENTMLSVC